MPGKTLTKTSLIDEISQKSTCTHVVIDSVLRALVEVIKEQLGPEGPGEVSIPHLVKFKTKATPATVDRPGVNAFTKQPITIKGKPASRKVKANVAKLLKDHVAGVSSA